MPKPPTADLKTGIPALSAQNDDGWLSIRGRKSTPFLAMIGGNLNRFFKTTFQCFRAIISFVYFSNFKLPTPLKSFSFESYSFIGARLSFNLSGFLFGVLTLLSDQKGLSPKKYVFY